MCVHRMDVVDSAAPTSSLVPRSARRKKCPGRRAGSWRRNRARLVWGIARRTAISQTVSLSFSRQKSSTWRRCVKARERSDLNRDLFDEAMLLDFSQQAYHRQAERLNVICSR
jgi:hypothetical protein